MNVQVIEKEGKPEWAVISYKAYLRLTQDAQVLQDIRAYDEAQKAIEEGEELVPSQVTYAILDGENPIKVWREHRGLTQQQLANIVGISTLYLSQLESDELKGSADILDAIARALDLSLDDIVDS